jgi:hypothetical protein
MTKVINYVRRRLFSHSEGLDHLPESSAENDEEDGISRDKSKKSRSGLSVHVTGVSNQRSAMADISHANIKAHQSPADSSSSESPICSPVKYESHKKPVQRQMPALTYAEVIATVWLQKRVSDRIKRSRSRKRAKRVVLHRNVTKVSSNKRLTEVSGNRDQAAAAPVRNRKQGQNSKIVTAGNRKVTTGNRTNLHPVCTEITVFKLCSRMSGPADVGQV